MAAELELGRSTTHRYASTLVALGYLEQSPSRKYRLSAAASNIGLSLLDSLLLRRAAHEHLAQLRTRAGHTVSLAVLADTAVAYIDRWQGSRQGQYAVDAGIGLGTHLPIHCTAAGKILVAQFPETERRRLVAKLRLKRRTAKTLTTKTALHAELQRIASEGGIAVDDEELLANRRALAAAISNLAGQPLAAVELTTPAAAYTLDELVKQFGPQVIATVEAIASTVAPSDADVLPAIEEHPR